MAHLPVLGLGPAKLNVSLSAPEVASQETLIVVVEWELGDFLREDLLVHRVEGSRESDGDHEGIVHWFALVQPHLNMVCDLLEGGQAAMQKPCVAATSRISEYLGRCKILLVLGHRPVRSKAKRGGGVARGIFPLHVFFCMILLRVGYDF